MQKEKLDTWGRPIQFKHQYKIKTFKTKNSLFYYLLGVFITDGNIFSYRGGQSCKSSISSKDLDWLTMINKTISDSNLISKKKQAYELRIYSTEIGNLLMKHGCVPNKSLTVRLPQIPKKYLKDFLRGCIDGDGSISLQKKKVKRPYKTYTYQVPTCYLCSASKQFIDDISEELTKLNLKHYIVKLIQNKNRLLQGKKITTTTPMYRILFNGTDCYNLLKWIDYSSQTPNLPRKTKTAFEIIEYFQNKKWGSIAINSHQKL